MRDAALAVGAGHRAAHGGRDPDTRGSNVGRPRIGVRREAERWSLGSRVRIECVMLGRGLSVAGPMLVVLVMLGRGLSVAGPMLVVLGRELSVGLGPMLVMLSRGLSVAGPMLVVLGRELSVGMGPMLVGSVVSTRRVGWARVSGLSPVEDDRRRRSPGVVSVAGMTGTVVVLGLRMIPTVAVLRRVVVVMSQSSVKRDVKPRSELHTQQPHEHRHHRERRVAQRGDRSVAKAAVWSGREHEGACSARV